MRDTDILLKQIDDAVAYLLDLRLTILNISRMDSKDDKATINEEKIIKELDITKMSIERSKIYSQGIKIGLFK